jgi:hypothetical protein
MSCLLEGLSCYLLTFETFFHWNILSHLHAGLEPCIATSGKTTGRSIRQIFVSGCDDQLAHKNIKIPRDEI